MDKAFKHLGLEPTCKICGQDCLGNPIFPNSNSNSSKNGNSNTEIAEWDSPFSQWDGAFRLGIYETMFLALLPNLRCLALKCNIPRTHCAEKTEPPILSFLRCKSDPPYFQNLREVYIQKDFVCTFDTLAPFLPLVHLHTLAVQKLQDDHEEADVSGELCDWYSRIPDKTSTIENLYLLNANASLERISRFLRKCRSLHKIIWKNQPPSVHGYFDKNKVWTIDIEYELGLDVAKAFEEKFAQKFP
jgi:hypothetical protein